MPCITESHTLIYVYRFFLVSVHILLLNTVLDAQLNTADSSDIIEKIISDRDTMVRSSLQNNWEKKWSELQVNTIDSILLRQKDSRIGHELYTILLRNSNGNNKLPKTPARDIGLIANDGKIIRSITFEKTAMFSSSLLDSTKVKLSSAENFLKNLHYNTRSRILKRYLMIKPGDSLNVFLLADNERLIRELPFIMDTRFLVGKDLDNKDSADLILVTQDLFPLGFEVELNKSTGGMLSVWNNNLLGYGHQITGTVFWDFNAEPILGYGFSYRMANIGGTFASGKMDYINRQDLTSIIVNVSREFRSTSFRYAGGAILEKTSIRKNFELTDSTLSDVQLNYKMMDLWAGRMFKLNSGSFPSRSSGIFLNARLNILNSHALPSSSLQYLFPYQSKTRILFSTGFSRMGYRKDNLIYTFGRTEDVPFGFLMDLTYGLEYQPECTRTYLALNGTYGNYLRNTSYLGGRFSLGTFVNKGISEQGAFNLQMNFFSRLYQVNRFQYRHFITFNYVGGISRFNGEFTTLEHKGGIEGLTGRSMRGNKKMVLNLESVVFSPFTLLGFRFAFFGEVDLGLVAPENSAFNASGIYTGFSAGVRIRNEQLVFNTFVIRLGLYPRVPEEGSSRVFTAGGMPRIRFQDYFPYKPDIISFQ
jgi:hypothetical protein